MKRNRIPPYAVLVCMVLLSWLILPAGAAAQGSVTWSEPFNVSNSPTSSIHPAVVADGYGYVHVFWSEDVDGQALGPEENAGAGDTILYRRWDGRSWSEPFDILAVSGDNVADMVAATVDGNNRIHLVWTGVSRLYYSSAPAAEAWSARAWSKPRTFSWASARSRYESDVAVDSQGTVHIAYAEKGGAAGVFHVAMPAGRTAWTSPVRISGYLRENEVSFNDVRLVVDAADRLHAAWGTSNTNGYNQAVYYARSEQAGESWDDPVLLADATIDTGFTGFPSLLPYGGDGLLLIHVDQGNKGHIERTSADDGKTWSEPRFVLSSMEGVGGFDIPLVDGGGGQHLVVTMRASVDQRGGIWYAPRGVLDWAPVILVASGEPSASAAHYADACVRLGNEIHVVWTELRGGEVWHVRGEIAGVAAATALALPTPAPEPLVTATATGAAATPTPAGRTATPRPASPTPMRTAIAPPGATGAATSSLEAALVGGLAAAVVVLAAALWARTRPR